MEVWTIKRILEWTTGYFRDKAIDSPRLDAELLLAHVLKCERIRLYMDYDKPLSPEERAAFRALVRRRAAYEPVAYILGEREFFSRSFEVNPAVLVPRPETEHLVEEVLGWAEGREQQPLRVLDIGTGSGALAVVLACELPQARVVATDISAEALEVARRNAERHGVAERVELRQGDLWAPARDEPPGSFDVIVSNPPYVETSVRASLMADVRDYEPHLALFAGRDGLDVLRGLIPGVPKYLASPGIFACEYGSSQRDAVRGLMESAGGWSAVRDIIDLQKLPRGVVGER